jgi:hypothetical protein
MKWEWWQKYVLNIDTLAAIIVGSLALYFIFTAKKKKYKFNISDVLDETKQPKYLTRSKTSKKPKRINKHEEECRRIFQEIFGGTFKSVRPKWLKNPVSNKNLELDGYNSSIETPIGTGLAFEYDGQQHAKYTPHFHKKGVDEFEYQVAKDSWKDQKCKDKGILLIRIPHSVDFNDLERYIKMILKRRNVKIPSIGLFSRSNYSDTPAEVYENFSNGRLYG